MKRFLNKMINNSLFIKMFLVMVISIVTVTVATSWLTMHMTTNLFMNTFGITNSKVIDQVKANFESYNYSIVTVLNRLQQSGSIKAFLTQGDSTSLSMFKTYYNVNQQMEQIASIVNSYNAGVTIVGVNGRSYSTNLIKPPLSNEELKQHAITQHAHAEPQRLIYEFYNGTDDAVTEQPNNAYVIAVKALRDSLTGEVFGTLYVTISEQDYQQFYNKVTSDGNDIAVLNRDKRIVSSNREDWLGRYEEQLYETADRMENQSLQNLAIKVMGQDSIVIAESLPTYDYYLVNVINKDVALGPLMDRRAITLITAAIVLVALIIVFLISRQMTKSLSLLVKQMSRVTRNNFDNYVTVKGGSEIRQLGEAYNYMLDELHDYVDKLVATQKEQRNAELEALQRQINPHFLYNTLASVKILVQQGSKEKAAETIHALIVLLQNAIGNVNETNNVADELEILKSYVFINQVRYGERIRVYYFVAPDCQAYCVPKLVIQPFIENAFFHAFHNKSEGYIHVMIHKEGEALICEVVDNGDGMGERNEQETLPRSKGKRQLFSGIGVKNVNSRIKLLYGEPYGVSISSQLGEGTRVVITLPLMHS